MNKKSRITALSAGIIILALVFKHIVHDIRSSNVLMIVSTIIAGYHIFKNALQSLKYRVLGIEALVSVAVIGALFLGEYWEAAAVSFLFNFGAYLEARTLEKTRSSLKSLFDLVPTTASVVRDGQEIRIDPEKVLLDEIVLVRPGEKIPVDGMIESGNALVNQAAITGESMPVEKGIGDSVFSSTVIESGYLQIQAKRVGEDTTFARILEMVEEAQDSKAPTQKFIEKFSRYYTPAIMVLSIVVYLITKDVELALTLLVIACPGAMVISAPVSIVAGIGNAAKHGILIKGGEYLEKAGNISIVAFDKTGTLTIGKPVVTKIKTFQIEEHELLRLSASVEIYSEHHLAKAIVTKAREVLSTEVKEAEQFEVLAGQGVRGMVDGRTILIGTRRFMQSIDINIGDEMEEYLQAEENNAQTAVLVADETTVLGIISIADQIREDAYGIVAELKQAGVKQVVMLTGDNHRTAAAVARELALDGFYAELLPQEKVEKIVALKQQGSVAMIGDGINDAPALATADIGIAMGFTGTDVAMETANIVLMQDNLHRIPATLKLSRSVMRVMKQNLYFSVGVVFTLLIGVLTRNVFMALGMLVHELSVILVILNAIRLLSYQPDKK